MNWHQGASVSSLSQSTMWRGRCLKCRRSRWKTPSSWCLNSFSRRTTVWRRICSRSTARTKPRTWTTSSPSTSKSWKGTSWTTSPSTLTSLRMLSTTLMRWMRICQWLPPRLMPWSKVARPWSKRPSTKCSKCIICRPRRTTLLSWMINWSNSTS